MRLARCLPVFAPLAVACLLGGVRHCCRPVEPAAPARAQPSLPLPLPVDHAPTKAATWKLAPAGSLARLEADSAFRCIRGGTAPTAGSLSFDDDGQPLDLAFTVELARLAPDDDHDLDAELQHLLGISANEPLHFQGRADRITSVPQPGLRQVRWSGQLQIAGRGHRLQLELWLATMRSDRIRLQGVAILDAGQLPMPRRFFLGVAPERYHFALGLDLEFHPRAH